MYGSEGKQESILPTYLCVAFLHVDPKSQKDSQITSDFLRFWDLLVNRWWNRPQGQDSQSFLRQIRKMFITLSL